jgi:hypothetical protein
VFDKEKLKRVQKILRIEICNENRLIRIKSEKSDLKP